MKTIEYWHAFCFSKGEARCWWERFRLVSSPKAIQLSQIPSRPVTFGRIYHMAPDTYAELQRQIHQQSKELNKSQWYKPKKWTNSIFQPALFVNPIQQRQNAILSDWVAHHQIALFITESAGVTTGKVFKKINMDELVKSTVWPQNGAQSDSSKIAEGHYELVELNPRPFDDHASDVNNVDAYILTDDNSSFSMSGQYAAAKPAAMSDEFAFSLTKLLEGLKDWLQYELEEQADKYVGNHWSMYHRYFNPSFIRNTERLEVRRHDALERVLNMAIDTHQPILELKPAKQGSGFGWLKGNSGRNPQTVIQKPGDTQLDTHADEVETP